MINHIGFIMDGNRRFSKKNNMPITKGYKFGMEQFFNFIKYQVKHNIFETSYYALSTENYKKRPIEEKKVIGNLVKEFSKNEEIWDFFKENCIKIEIKGDIAEVEENEKHQKVLESFFVTNLKERLEKHNANLTEIKFKANLALNYGGQREIVHSFKQILAKIKTGEIKEEDINENTIKENIYFNDSNPPEILVRPGDAPRLSGFMLWDSNYSEIYFTKKLWPELEEQDFTDIIDWFLQLKRNFGK